MAKSQPAAISHESVSGTYPSTVTRFHVPHEYRDFSVS